MRLDTWVSYDRFWPAHTLAMRSLQCYEVSYEGRYSCAGKSLLTHFVMKHHWNEVGKIVKFKLKFESSKCPVWDIGTVNVKVWKVQSKISKFKLRRSDERFAKLTFRPKNFGRKNTGFEKFKAIHADAPGAVEPLWNTEFSEFYEWR